MNCVLEVHDASGRRYRLNGSEIFKQRLASGRPMSPIEGRREQAASAVSAPKCIAAAGAASVDTLGWLIQIKAGAAPQC